MRRPVLAALLALPVLVAGLSGARAATATAVVLQAPFLRGGAAQIEVESANVRPVVCFSFSSPLPADGDSIRAGLRRAGSLELVQELGTGHQWVNGSVAGCEVPASGAVLAALVASPGNYVVTFEVVEPQGNPPLPGLIATTPLRRA